VTKDWLLPTSQDIPEAQSFCNQFSQISLSEISVTLKASKLSIFGQDGLTKASISTNNFEFDVFSMGNASE
jgi:hypothetical protein